MRQEGIAKLDKKTKDLVKRLTSSDIAIIDHTDMDRVSAETLVASGVEVVINASPSISGSYPNTGPLILTRGGVALIDDVGPEIFDRLREGDDIIVEDGNIFHNGELIARGKRLSVDEIDARMESARDNIGDRLDEFARNTIEYLEKEKDILTKDMWVPPVKTELNGRHVLVVVRGYDFKEDLKTLTPYIREMKPVLIGVDGGADAIIDAGFTPDIIIGDMDSVTDAALTGGAELIVHAYKNGNAPGLERLNELGVGEQAFVWPLTATSEDLALLLAYENGADLIVALGTHANLIEYLDKGRKGMSSSFLVRLKVGSKLVDAKGVNKLYRSTVSVSHMVPLIGAAMLIIVVVIALSPTMRSLLSLAVMRLRLVLGI